jgi:hypothetical protein
MHLDQSLRPIDERRTDRRTFIEASNKTRQHPVISTLASLALCQESRVYREGSNWVQEMTGRFRCREESAGKAGRGFGAGSGWIAGGITYVIHRKAYTSSEEQARRQFESYGFSATVKGRHGVDRGGVERAGFSKCSDELVVNVPRNLEAAKSKPAAAA